MSDVIVRMCHVRAALNCSKGTRAFAKRHGFDWGRFLREGIPASQLEHLDDAMVKKVLEVARGQQ